MSHKSAADESKSAVAARLARVTREVLDLTTNGVAVDVVAIDTITEEMSVQNHFAPRKVQVFKINRYNHSIFIQISLKYVWIYQVKMEECNKSDRDSDAVSEKDVPESLQDRLIVRAQLIGLKGTSIGPEKRAIAMFNKLITDGMSNCITYNAVYAVF